MAQFRSKYTGRYSGIGSMLQRPGMQRACKDAAIKLMGLAEGVSPTGDPEEDRHPGLYRASFDVVPIYKNVPFRGKPRIRPGARLINTAPHAWRVEKGDGRVPRYAPMQRAIDALKVTRG
ncbi:hypothetical protein ACIQMR_35160 [Streptomyces sp. NPDC091376]|uniref:hypothetical protein n=1 Tax=Streptomyces sp. NPDC091376 TaxID=3365994 RepID=UPI003804B5EA